MKKTKQQPQQERKSSGIRLDTELVKKLKILAIKRDCRPNELLEEAILNLLKRYGEV
jgi:predicted transcriptional regulator